MIPTLESDRLILRPMTFADWPDYAALMQSDRAGYMGGPMTGTQAWAAFTHDIALWRLMGHGALMIDERESGQCPGSGRAQSRTAVSRT